MNRPRVVTVLSVRPWEAAFVALATTTARLRLIARAVDGIDVVRHLDTADVVVVGSETPWLEQWLFDTIHAFGTLTIGLHPAYDRTGDHLLAKATVRLPETTPTDRLVDAAVALGQSSPVAGQPTTRVLEPRTHR